MKTVVIDGIETNYGITEDGKLYSYHLNRFIIPYQDRGYLQTRLIVGNIRKNFRIHRLVALTFIPNIYNLPHINHINNDRADNRVENLEWIDNAGNVAHKVAQSRQSKLKGSDNPISKLIEKDIIKIRKLYKTGNYSHRELAKLYSISHCVIGKIIRKQAWSHV